MRILLFFSGIIMAFQAWGETPSLAAVLCGKAVKQSDKIWYQNYWADAKMPQDAKVYIKRNPHCSTMMYWAFMDFKLNGNVESRRMALAHYDYIVKNFWDEKKQIFRTDYDFLMDGSIAIALGMALQDAESAIPDNYRKDMKEKLRGIAAYLPIYTTALKNTNYDLRANNQDAFAAYALALAAAQLDDLKIRNDALVKFRSVLAIVTQSFWCEGGIDIGYQSVGTPAFMAAADILWNDLSSLERRQVNDLLLCNRVGNGFGLENCRSSSWVKSDSRYTFASGILDRAVNPWATADVLKIYREAAANGLKSHWWLIDPASVIFFAGVMRLENKISLQKQVPDQFAWGSLGFQSMEQGEAGSKDSAERAYLTGSGGVTAIFGDNAHQSFMRAKAKYGNEHAPRCWNSGGMRYLGWKDHLYIWADDLLGCPRLFSREKGAVPQLVSRRMYRGFAASEYMLTQVMPGFNNGKPVFVEQTFVAVDRVVVALFRSEDTLGGLSYDFTVPNNGRIIAEKNVVTVPEKWLKSATLRVKSFNGKTAVVDPEPWMPYFKKQLGTAGGKVDPPRRLTRISISFENRKYAVLVFIPEDHGAASVKNIRLTEEDGFIALEFSVGDKNYALLTALKKLDRITSSSVAVDKPQEGFMQLVTRRGDVVTGFSAHAEGLSVGGKTLFSAKTPALISFLRVKDGGFVSLEGKVRFSSEFGRIAASMFDSRRVDLQGEVENERLWISDK